jgi:hypothetical protein
MEQDKEVDGFARLWWRETKEGDAAGGARLTIESGAQFPVSIRSNRRPEHAAGWKALGRRGVGM